MSHPELSLKGRLHLSDHSQRHRAPALTIPWKDMPTLVCLCHLRDLRIPGCSAYPPGLSPRLIAYSDSISRTLKQETLKKQILRSCYN